MHPNVKVLLAMPKISAYKLAKKNEAVMVLIYKHSAIVA